MVHMFILAYPPLKQDYMDNKTLNIDYIIGVVLIDFMFVE
jgi:hypothetical protein